MIFIEILQAFRSFALSTLPFLVAALALGAVAMEYFPPHALDKLIQQNRTGTTLVSALVGLVLPATAAYRVPMAAMARKGGSSWTPILVFVATATAGVSTFLATMAAGLGIALLRAVVSLVFAVLLTAVVARLLEPRFAGAAMDVEVEPLFSHDFSEGSVDYIEKTSNKLHLKSAWHNFLQLARVMLPWFFLSLFMATLIHVTVSAQTISAFVGGRFGTFKAALIGVPFYFAGGTDVPIVLALTRKGVGLGAVVSFMLAAPVVNVPVISIIGRWIGYRRAISFILACWLTASIIGLAIGYLDVR